MKEEKTDVVQSVRALADPMVEEQGFDLVDVQYRRERNGWILRLFIDKAWQPGADASDDSLSDRDGITMDDCVLLSREIGALLEISDTIPTAYSLEVSSPGLDRPLIKPLDFERFAGSSIKVKLKVPLDGKRTLKGRLLEYGEGEIKLELNGEPLPVRLDETERITLVPEINWDANK